MIHTKIHAHLYWSAIQYLVFDTLFSSTEFNRGGDLLTVSINQQIVIPFLNQIYRLNVTSKVHYYADMKGTIRFTASQSIVANALKGNKACTSSTRTVNLRNPFVVTTSM